MKNRNLLLYIVSALLSVFFLGYVLLNLDWEILHSAFADFHWIWLGFALTAYLVNIALRALRFSNLIYSRRATWLELVPVSALHNILMYLMPAKTGDMTYIFIVKNRMNVSLTEGASTLLAARFYDFTVVALILAILLPFSKNEMPDWIFRSALLFCVLILLGAFAILVFLRSSKPTAEIENSAPSASKSLLIRINIAWKKFVSGLREIQAHSTHRKLTLLTAGIWVCIYSNFYFAAQSMGLPISFHHIVIISIVMIPLTLLPLQGFANIGTHEVGWVSVLVAFNYPYDMALAIAAGSHFVLLISVLISGGIAFFGARFIDSIYKRKHDQYPIH
jgi:hypothetical protein